MKKSNSPKAKKPTRQRRFLFSRAFWIEILFFIALGVFAFSAVMSWMRGEENIVLYAAPGEQHIEEEAVAQAPMLYEAPSGRARPDPTLSPIFSPSVQYWADDLMEWAAEYGLDPNAIATLMQIESCGDPRARSYAGASGLFQVMPFHFAEGEDLFDPDTNAMRGLAYFSRGLELSGGHVGLSMAGYNGGHGIIARSYENWPTESQRYYRWGTGIYREASAGWESSPTLSAWLSAGGQSLCAQAEARLGIQAGR